MKKQKDNILDVVKEWAWSLIHNKKNQMFFLRKLPFDCEVRGHCMCKEMPVIPVNRVVDKKKKLEKGGGEARPKEYLKIGKPGANYNRMGPLTSRRDRAQP
jgi:hypothetical protein